MLREVAIIRRVNIINIIICLIFVFTLTSCNENVNHKKKVDIYNVVKDAYLTDKGYTEDLSKHMSKDTFNLINIYSVYGRNGNEYKKPFKINFSLKEISQKNRNDKVNVKMLYDLEIRDDNNKYVSGSAFVDVTFKVEIRGDNWYITDKDEDA